jgi:quercetin dioxygenase-like cupin family protein
MAPLLARSLDSPDERREFASGRLDVVQLGDRHVGRFTLEPGWRWSRSVAPVVGTDSCGAAHLGYVVSGRLHVRMNDGTEGEAGPGDAYWIAPGHDAWVAGDEPAVVIDVEGAAAYGAG